MLAGLGVAELSVSVPAVAAVKARLRAVDCADARAARRAARWPARRRPRSGRWCCRDGAGAAVRWSPSPPTRRSTRRSGSRASAPARSTASNARSADAGRQGRQRRRRSSPSSACAVERPGSSGVDERGAASRRSWTTAAIADGFVRVAGATRTGIKIVDHDGGTHHRRQLPRLRRRLGRRWSRCSSAVVAESRCPGAGSCWPAACRAGVPADLYRRLTEVGARARRPRRARHQRRAAGRRRSRPGPTSSSPTATSSRSWSAVRSHDRARSLGAARRAARPRHRHGGGLARGRRRAVRPRRARRCSPLPPPVDVASTVGAGDAMVAGTVARPARRARP